MAEIAEAYVTHLTPNRVRLKVPGRRRDERFFADVREQISRWPSVALVEVNPVTGSILIHAAANARALVANPPRSELFRFATSSQDESQPLDLVHQEILKLDRQLQEMSGRGGNLLVTVFLLFLITGIVQAWRGHIAPPALTLFWYAAATLRLWGRNYPAEAGAERE
jgi:hypothetical protein